MPKTPETNSEPNFHSDIILRQWNLLGKAIKDGAEPVPLAGGGLEISQVAAISRYDANTIVSSSAFQSLITSLENLERRLAGGEIIYGVNTGFGGTADVRSQKTKELQRVLTRELLYGILPDPHSPLDQDSKEFQNSESKFQYDTTLEGSIEITYLPRSWTRAAIAIRINSLLKGCSGVRPVIVERLQDLLKHDIIPMVPLRGSISASGDLSPLAYIAGAIQGKPTIRLLAKCNQSSRADLALHDLGLEPVILQAKEGLAIVNGTAISAGAGALALHDTCTLVILAQMLTAMSVEALAGTTESFDPFFAKTRPHPGQIESASNIFAFLEGSKLTKVNTGTVTSLRQDRYSIRTASQWLGPVLEDLALSHQQISIECNSATDNPLITPNGDFLHGGNFQAKAVTSAMEKTRQSIQSIGRMLFSQCTEIINPATSRGLPPNLVAEDPSSSYIFKGADLNIAALQSELGFLANPVNHVMTAEMGNQSLNSLALIAARYTHTANDVLSQLIAVHLVSLCQALDLRVMHVQFLEAFRTQFHHILGETWGVMEQVEILEEQLWAQLLKNFDATVSLDARERFTAIAQSLRTVFFDYPNPILTSISLQSMQDFTTSLASSLHDTWCAHRDAYLKHGNAIPFLGKASKALYQVVRRDLEVPMLSSQRITTPKSPGEREPLTVGDFNGRLYRAIKNGCLGKVAVDVLREVQS